jgi:hypothetical protein
MVTDHPIRHAVQPEQTLVAAGDVVDPAPRREERLGHDVVDDIPRHAPAAEVSDRAVVAMVEGCEERLVTRPGDPCGLPSHVTPVSIRRCSWRPTAE